MVHKNGVTGDAIFDIPVIVESQLCDLLASATARAGCIGFQLPNTVVAHS
jgi:hypothetical protein